MIKERKQEYRRYKQMRHKFRKQLVNTARKFEPWDYSYMFDVIKVMIDYLYTYYTNSDNVWQSEESLTSVVNSLTEVRNLLNMLDEDTFENEAYEFSKKHCKHSCENHVWSYEWDSEESAETHYNMLREAEEKRQSTWNKMFKLMAENIRSWWD